MWQEQTKKEIIPVLTFKEVADVKPVLSALVKGCIKAVEITLRTDNSLQVLAEAVKYFKGNLLIGSGTVLSTQQAQEVKDIGVDFALSPGINAEVLNYAKKINLPFIPGVATPSDIELALSHSLTILKIFPAEALGGIKYMQAIYVPYKHRGITFIPLGGISVEGINNYMKLDMVHAVGGSSVASDDLISSKNYQQITNNALQARYPK